MTTEAQDVLVPNPSVQSADPAIQQMANDMMQEQSDLSRALADGTAITESLGSPAHGMVQPMNLVSAPSTRVKLWRLDTGEELDIIPSMAKATLDTRDEQGNPVFTSTPQELKSVGVVKCKLHPDDPNRPQWDAMGLPVCDLEGIDNIHERDLHVELAHVRSSAAIKRVEAQQKDDKQDAERREDRVFMRGILSAIGGNAVPGHVHQYDEDGFCVAHELCDATKPEGTNGDSGGPA